jgi:hypothetical protein
METNSQHTHKSDEEIKALALQICRMLNGVPIGQALNLVKNEVPLLLGDGHLVDISTQRFAAMETCALG